MKPFLTGCVLHSTPDSRLPSIQVQLEGRPIITLLDSGSTITLTRPSILPSMAEVGSTVKVICVHGDAQEVAIAKVRVGGNNGEWVLLVEIMADLPVSLLIG